jgi:GTPase
MKKRMLAVILMACAVWVAADDQAAGLVVLGEDLIAIAEIKDYEIKSALFKLKNESTETIRIEKFTPTCPCVLAKTDKEEIGPGAEALVRVTLNGSAARPGAFVHSVWVETSDDTRFKLSITGTLIPLISGFPGNTENITFDEGETAFTNRYLLSVSEDGVLLGAPQVTADENVAVALSVVTNQGERVSYDVSVALSLVGEGRKRATVHFPVLGKEGVDLKDSDLSFSITSGKTLKVVPNRLMVGNDAQLRLLISDRKRKLDSHLLTWEPRLDGLSVNSQESRLGQGLVVTVTLDAKAAAELVDFGRMKFNYPGYQSVEVPVLGR